MISLTGEFRLRIRTAKITHRKSVEIPTQIDHKPASRSSMGPKSAAHRFRAMSAKSKPATVQKSRASQTCSYRSPCDIAPAPQRTRQPEFRSQIALHKLG